MEQTKLTHNEWNATEVPVSATEREILQFLCDGYYNVNLIQNNHLSLFQVLKIDMMPENEWFLFQQFLWPKVASLLKEKELLSGEGPTGGKKPKKVDLMRVENMDIAARRGNIFEFVLLEIMKQIHSAPSRSVAGIYTLMQLRTKHVLHINRHMQATISQFLAEHETITCRQVLGSARDCLASCPWY